MDILVNLWRALMLVGVVLTMNRDYVELYESTGVALWRAVYAYSGGRRDIADDAVAEAFARAIQYEGQIRRPESWLYRTAFRIAAAELRRTARFEPLEGAGSVTEVNPDLAVLLAALRKVSPNQRAAVYLHYLADLPTRDVARYMGTSVATVKVHLHRGRRRLRELLGDEEVGND